MAQIRSGLATRLAAISGDYQVSAYQLSAPTPPCLVVSRGPITYDQTMGRGGDEMRFTVIAYVQFTTDQGSQKKLDVLAAPSGVGSLKAVVEADKTLGGVVDDTWVSEATEERVYEAPGKPPMLGCEWTVLVLDQAS